MLLGQIYFAGKNKTYVGGLYVNCPMLRLNKSTSWLAGSRLSFDSQLGKTDRDKQNDFTKNVLNIKQRFRFPLEFCLKIPPF
jgi:hypothetical protein